MSSDSIEFVIEEGVYSISEEELNKKMSAFQQSTKLTEFIRSKLDSKGIGRISIEFEPKPLVNEIVASWLGRSKDGAQILVSLNKTVYESMRKVTSGLEISSIPSLLSSLSSHPLIVNQSLSTAIASAGQSDKGDSDHMSTIQLVFQCIAVVKQNNELQTKVALLETKMAQHELSISKLEATLSSVELDNKQRVDRLEKEMREHLERTKRKEEMLVVSDMIVNFYKAFVFVNKEHFTSCFRDRETGRENNGVNLKDFYEKLSDESTRGEIVSRINASTNAAAFDGLDEINTNVKRVRNGQSHPLDSIDKDFRFDFERYLTYLKEEVDQLTFFNVNGNFILDLMKELVKPK